jgi:tetratricopeptide (TPR) repeat protein
LGTQVLVVERPAIVHLLHKTAYIDKSWRDLGLAFARFIAREAIRAELPLPSSIRSLVPIARVVAESSDTSAVDDPISKMAVQYSAAVRDNVAYFTPDTADTDAVPLRANEGMLTPSEVFRGFEDRAFAGDALENAKRLEKEGKANEAEAGFQAALERAPADFDVLFSAGEYWFRRGNRELALQFLRRAEAEQPDSSALMGSIAVTLCLAARQAEAIPYFEKVVKADPENQIAHYNLAITLYDLNRREDAMRCLDSALKKWPGFQ